jgi:hypothetical protein
VSEALLFAGPNAVLDVIMSIMVSERTQLCSKVQAADLLSAVCSQSKACLLLSPGFVVERLMRCAYKGHSDARSAASRALWQLSCHHDFSPEVGASVQLSHMRRMACSSGRGRVPTVVVLILKRASMHCKPAAGC